MTLSPSKPVAVERKLAYGMVAVGWLMVAAVASSYFIKVAADRVEELGAESLARSVELDRALVSILDAETRQRGFLITGRDEQLQPYEGARVRAASAFTNLRFVYAEDSATLHDIELLAQTAQRKLTQLQAAIDARKAGASERARALVAAEDDRETMERVLGTLADLKQREAATHDHLARVVDGRRTVLLYVEVLVLALMLGGGVVAYRSLAAQVRARQALSDRLAQQALQDALTLLPNRRHFSDELARSIARAARKDEQRALLFIDLDGFKRINDELGHHVGDQLLQAVAQRFAGVVRRSDFVARLGGDEFAVLLEAYTAEGAQLLAQRLIQAVQEPLLPAHPEHRISASIGIAVYPQDANEPTGLLSRADAAMYLAKHAGKGTVRTCA
ncbi:diguanylate cyclase domain-containing protein [Ideonella sp. BN130291]|uniref:diguanylate cyclase domain-containing protein n=1 Tax=Ideonella sp. BN130291 TaxID=3112940 RepID=UPI002E2579C2|nr:diguanylate cyclase [Ideonella sp. BN130291]